MKDTKEFMLMFRLEPTTEQPTAEQMQELGKSWGEFIGNIAMQGKLVSTHQLGYEGTQIFADHSSTEGIRISEGRTLSGNMILKADSLEVASELAKNCPILKYAGGTVEVRSIIPM